MIRIPQTLLTCPRAPRDEQRELQLTDIGVPLAHGMIAASDFNYTVDPETGDVLLTNCKAIKAGRQQPDPDRVVGGCDGRCGRDGLRLCGKASTKGEERPDSNAITGSIDTSAEGNVRRQGSRKRRQGRELEHGAKLCAEPHGAG